MNFYEPWTHNSIPHPIANSPFLVLTKAWSCNSTRFLSDVCIRCEVTTGLFLSPAGIIKKVEDIVLRKWYVLRTLVDINLSPKKRFIFASVLRAYHSRNTPPVRNCIIWARLFRTQRNVPLHLTYRPMPISKSEYDFLSKWKQQSVWKVWVPKSESTTTKTVQLSRTVNKSSVFSVKDSWILSFWNIVSI